MAPQPIIRRAIDAISREYVPGVEQWLAEKNPLALRNLTALQDRLDAAALSCGLYDSEAIKAVERAANAWQGNWLFWIKNFKQNGGK